MANGVFDAHQHDPEFGYRLLADEARAVGHQVAGRTVWRICSGNRWWSAFGRRKRSKNGARVGPPAHDDLVRRDVSANRPNER